MCGQEREPDLRDLRITIKMENQPLGAIFRYLMENYDIPIGFEQSTLDRNHSDYRLDTNLPARPRHTSRNAQGIEFTTTYEGFGKAEIHSITVDVKNGGVDEVFNQIVEQMGNYKWEINDGVINIFPTLTRDERFEKLLDLKIKRFALEKGKTVKDITATIKALPEFKVFMEKKQLHFSGARIGMNFVIKAQYGRMLDKEMDFSDLSFRDLLNKITKVKRGAWALKWLWFTPTGEEYIDIDI